MQLAGEPGANIIETVDNIKAHAAGVAGFYSAVAASLEIISDRTKTIRASVNDIEFTLMLTVALVVMVIFLFLRNAWATVIPSISVPLSIVGTFGVMYLLDYSLDNLSLMALAICTGFVVDDAIVVIENITRYLEAGDSPLEAAMKGSHEIGFTVLSMSTSLIARLHSHLADGRDRRKAVPGICGHVERGHRGFVVRFAHHDADDVRQIS